MLILFKKNINLKPDFEELMIIDMLQSDKLHGIDVQIHPK